MINLFFAFLPAVGIAAAIVAGVLLCGFIVIRVKGGK